MGPDADAAPKADMAQDVHRKRIEPAARVPLEQLFAEQHDGGLTQAAFQCDVPQEKAIGEPHAHLSHRSAEQPHRPPRRQRSFRALQLAHDRDDEDRRENGGEKHEDPKQVGVTGLVRYEGVAQAVETVLIRALRESEPGGGHTCTSTACGFLF